MKLFGVLLVTLSLLSLSNVMAQDDSYDTVDEEGPKPIPQAKKKQQQQSGDEKSKGPVTPGVKLEVAGTGGVQGKAGQVKVAPKGGAHIKVEGHVGVGNDSVEVKAKVGATGSAQASTEDLGTGDHREASEGAVGIHGAVEASAAKGMVKAEGKLEQKWHYTSGQARIISGLFGVCSSPGEKNEKLQMCASYEISKALFDKGYTATGHAGSVLLVKPLDKDTRLFIGPRVEHIKIDSDASKFGQDKSPTTFVGITAGATFQ